MTDKPFVAAVANGEGQPFIPSFRVNNVAGYGAAPECKEVVIQFGGENPTDLVNIVVDAGCLGVVIEQLQEAQRLLAAEGESVCLRVPSNWDVRYNSQSMTSDQVVLTFDGGAPHTRMGYVLQVDVARQMGLGLAKYAHRIKMQQRRETRQ